MDTIQKTLHRLNNNKYLLGIMLILLNVGSKFIDLRLNDYHEKLMRDTIGKELLVFAITFVGTRDIAISLVVTSVFFILNDYILNEDSEYCLVPKKYRLSMKNIIDTNNNNKIDQKEIEYAINILNRAKQQQIKETQKNAYMTFMNNL